VPDFIGFYVENTGFQGKDPVRCEIVISVYIVQYTNTGSYLDCSVSRQKEKNITVKISRFLQITGIVNRSLKRSQVQKHTRLKIYNTSALHNLLYGYGTW
jgi:hypothetical protein